MTKSIQVEDDLHSDLEFLKGHFRTKSFNDTIRRIMYHAGFRQEWFEMAEKWRDLNTPEVGE
jgi:predicted CopG family antitoxin